MALPSTALAAVPQGSDAKDTHGYEKRYTIHADAALLPDGVVLQPAYVTLDKGTIARVSTQPPAARRGLFGGEQAPAILRVPGTLAPAVVDAWSGLPIDGRNGGRRPNIQARIAEDLPIADHGLAASVGLLRDSGVAFAYVGRTDANLQRGYGVSVAFGADDMPHVVGSEWADYSLAGSGPVAQIRAQEFTDLFDRAVVYRDAQQDHADAVEDWKEELEKYEEKLQKFIDEQKKAEKEGKDQGGAPQQGGNGNGDQEKKRPKRPERPKLPNRDISLEMALEAIDGEVPIRVHADHAFAIERVLAAQAKHDLDLVLVGGAEAVAHADALADADIPVILDLGRQFGSEDGAFARDVEALHAAGVRFALSSGGRDLGPLLLTLAGELIADGVDADLVWAALTTEPAAILGIEGQAGRLRTGAHGSLILYGGSSPFDASGVFRSHKPN